MKYSKIKVKELLSGDLGNVSTDENYKNLLFNKNISNNLLLEKKKKENGTSIWINSAIIKDIHDNTFD